MTLSHTPAQRVKEQAAVMLAWADGQRVQFRSRHREDIWHDDGATGKLAWNFEDFEYRVAPVPLDQGAGAREWDVWADDTGRVHDYCETSAKLAAEWEAQGYRKIRVREVTPDDEPLPPGVPEFDLERELQAELEPTEASEFKYWISNSRRLAGYRWREDTSGRFDVLAPAESLWKAVGYVNREGLVETDESGTPREAGEWRYYAHANPCVFRWRVSSAGRQEVGEKIGGVMRWRDVLRMENLIETDASGKPLHGKGEG